MTENVLTVSEFVNRLKGVIDNVPYFKNVALVGEISNFKSHASGHFYFSLKDKGSRISCVMFRSYAGRVMFPPKDGDRVVIHGRLDVFVDAGTVQIYAERMNLDGLGDLYIQYEKLKKYFHEKGYFDPALKKEIPAFPHAIAVITGAGSAAHADISRTLQERWPLAVQHDLLAYVQGEQAVQSVMAQLNEAQRLGVDVVILARGGGSIEDLWAFNDERLIEKLHTYPIPLITGIGHETDSTLSEFAADYRAATPTAAAVAATPNQKEIRNLLRDYKNKYYVNVVKKLQLRTQQLSAIQKRQPFANPLFLIEHQSMKLDYIRQRIQQQTLIFQKVSSRLQLEEQQMQNAMKLKLEQQKRACENAREGSMRSIQQHLERMSVRVNYVRRQHVQYGSYLQQNIKNTNQQLTLQKRSLHKQMDGHLRLKKQEYLDIIKALDLLSPLKIMARGYALTYHETNLIRSINDIEVDDTITIRYGDGHAVAKVTERKQEDEQ